MPPAAAKIGEAHEQQPKGKPEIMQGDFVRAAERQSNSGGDYQQAQQDDTIVGHGQQSAWKRAIGYFGC